MENCYFNPRLTPNLKQVARFTHRQSQGGKEHGDADHKLLRRTGGESHAHEVGAGGSNTGRGAGPVLAGGDSGGGGSRNHKGGSVAVANSPAEEDRNHHVRSFRR